jgi:hypothetical protein
VPCWLFITHHAQTSIGEFLNLTFALYNFDEFCQYS